MPKNGQKKRFGRPVHALSLVKGYKKDPIVPKEIF